MHESNEFLRSLALVLGVAALTTVLFQRLRQPVVLGYILAGLIIGPHVPVPLVADMDVVQTLSELGVILLMFSLGLDFSFAKLAKVGPAASLTAALQSALMLWLGYGVGRWLGWGALESLFAGALIAISSTTIIAKAYDDLKVKGPLRELVVGVLVVEDLIAIVLMASLTALASGRGLGAGQMLDTLGSLGGFLALLVAGGMLVVPRAMRAVGRFGSDETLLVAAVGLSFILALLAHEAGYSVALGAFLAGMLVAESGQEKRVEALVAPLRDIFAAVFFVSVGMLLDPSRAAQNAGAVLAFTLAVVLGKLAFVFMGAFLTGRGVRTAAQAGMSLAQIGEFSFIIAGLGASLGAVGSQLYPVAVSVSALTTLFTPWMIRASAGLAERLESALPERLQTFASLYGAWVERLGAASQPGPRGRAWRLAGWTAVDAALLAGLAVVTLRQMGPASAWMEARLGLAPAVSSLVAGLGALVLGMVLCLGIFSLTRRLALMLAEGALPLPAQGGLDSSAAPRRALSAALQAVFLSLAVMPLLAATQPFLPWPAVAGVLALSFTAMTAFFWRRAADLQGHVRAGSEMLMELLASQGRRHAPSISELEPLKEFLPGLGAPKVLRMEAGCPGVGLTLAQLKLRGRCGATVLAVEREGKGLRVRGKLALQPGDLLAVAGSSQSLASAEELLLGKGERDAKD